MKHGDMRANHIDARSRELFQEAESALLRRTVLVTEGPAKDTQGQATSIRIGNHGEIIVTVTTPARRRRVRVPVTALFVGDYPAVRKEIRPRRYRKDVP